MHRNPDIRVVGANATQKPIQTITLVRLSTELGWIARQQQASTSRASRIGSTRRARHELACDPESMPPARLRRHGARFGERRMTLALMMMMLLMMTMMMIRTMIVMDDADDADDDDDADADADADAEADPDADADADG